VSSPADPVREFDLPGIGRRFELTDANGRPVTVVVHHTGRRDLYAPAPDRSPTVLTFTDGQARRLAAVLGGVYFTPAAVAEVEAVIGGLLIDWVTLRPDSPGVGHSLADLEIRRRTRMTVAAILRGDHPVVSPDPGEVLAAGDRLVVLGRPEDLPGFVAAVVG
jgi:TrkA domain protein